MDVLYNSFCGGIVLVPVDVTGTNQDISTRARKAENIVWKEAKQKNANALQEFSNKRRCIQFEQNERDRETAQSQLTTAPIRKKVFEIRTTAFKNGDRVDVLADNSPGKCSHGGTGWITEVKRTGGSTLSTVRYDKFPSEARGTTKRIFRSTVYWSFRPPSSLL
jgi:hypothetical protein